MTVLRNVIPLNAIETKCNDAVVECSIPIGYYHIGSGLSLANIVFNRVLIALFESRDNCPQFKTHYRL